MFRKILAALALASFGWLATITGAYAAVDVNTADQTQLQTIKGIGPAISAKIIEERKKGNFKDWSDLETRVKGIGDKNSATFSGGGLTVGGQAKANAPAMAAPAAKAATKADAKAAAPMAAPAAATPAAAAPAAAATPMKKADAPAPAAPMADTKAAKKPDAMAPTAPRCRDQGR